MYEKSYIGGGLAGLSAGLYLGRSRRDTLLIHSGRSMAKWEADVQNDLGSPDGTDGTDLLKRGHMQVARFHGEIIEDEVRTLKKDDDTFQLFAVKFYTEEGNYDLVGNNIPVFHSGCGEVSGPRPCDQTGTLE